MNKKQRQILSLRDTDIDGALYRCCDNEELYVMCMRTFLNDKTMENLVDAVKKKSWNSAFTSAHALKGLAGNMGFVPLMHSVGQLVVQIRGGRTNDVMEYILEVESCYRDIVDAIREFLAYQV